MWSLILIPPGSQLTMAKLRFLFHVARESKCYFRLAQNCSIVARNACKNQEAKLRCTRACRPQQDSFFQHPISFPQRRAFFLLEIDEICVYLWSIHAFCQKTSANICNRDKKDSFLIYVRTKDNLGEFENCFHLELMMLK